MVNVTSYVPIALSELDFSNDFGSGLTFFNDVNEIVEGITYEDILVTRDDLGWGVNFGGTGFAFGLSGSISGTVQRLEGISPGEVDAFAMDGLSISLAAIIAATATESLDDGLVIWTAQFSGDDIFTFTGADDQMLGFDGKDLFNGFGGDDSLKGNAGNDTINGGNGNDKLWGNDGKDVINGGKGADNIKGGSGRDQMNGGGGGDTISGGNGADTLNGQAGNDVMHGGKGKDVFTDGSGADTFQFVSASDSLNNNTADRITDFQTGQDLIDLSGLSDELVFIGSAGFSGVGNEVRLTKSGGNTLVRIDLDGDGGGEIKIILDDVTSELSITDFIL